MAYNTKVFLALFVLGVTGGVTGTTPEAQAATNIPFTVTISEPATVDTTGGTPRIPIDVGGTTRYASYASGSGTSTLTFTYSTQPGDLDLDGIAVSSPIDLNGGTIKDSAGNNATLTFTPPNTSAIKVDYPSLSMDFINSDYILSGTHYNTLSSLLAATSGTFTRASTATYVDSSGSIQTAATDTPRFDYDPITHSAKGILVEENRTNSLLHSEQIDNASWIKNGGTITADTITAPTGLTTADKFVESAANTSHNITQNVSLTASTTYTITTYAKAAERNWLRIQADDGGTNTSNANYDLSSCALGVTGGSGTFTVASSIQSSGNGWCRISMTYSVGAATSRIIFALRTADGFSSSAYAGDGTSGMYIWGTQLEQGTFATSYIPTTTATVTRAADNLIVPTSTWYNATAGTLWGEATAYNAIAALTNAGSPTIASINNSAASNIARIGRYAANPSTGFFQCLTASVTNTNLGTWANGTSQKIAGTYSPSGFSYILGTNSLYTQGPHTISATFDQLRIGQYAASGYWSSTISRVKYYPTQVANSQLHLLTQ